MEVSSSSGEPVKDAVIAILNNGQLISKGVTSKSGKYVDNLNTDGLTSIEIYANKGGFIQGHTSKNIDQGTSNQYGLKMVDIHTSSEVSQGTNSLGSFVSLNIKLANTLDIMSVSYTHLRAHET